MQLIDELIWLQCLWLSVVVSHRGADRAYSCSYQYIEMTDSGALGGGCRVPSPTQNMLLKLDLLFIQAKLGFVLDTVSVEITLKWGVWGDWGVYMKSHHFGVIFNV